MTREQMVATLTLMGWEPGGHNYLIHNSGRQVCYVDAHPCIAITVNNVYGWTDKDITWGDYSDTELQRAMHLVTKEIADEQY